MIATENTEVLAATKISGKFLNARSAAQRVKGRRPGIVTQKTQIFGFKEAMNILSFKLNILFLPSCYLRFLRLKPLYLCGKAFLSV
jgi:hypothetical protein